MNYLLQGGTSQQGVNNGAVVVNGHGHAITVNNNANRISVNATAMADSIPIGGTNTNPSAPASRKTPGKYDQPIISTGEKGVNGLPLMPSGLMKIELKDINTKHAEKWFAYQWILNPLRKDGEWQTKVNGNITNYNAFVGEITTLRDEIGRKSAKLTREAIIDKFREEGLQIRGQGVSEFDRDIGKFIGSLQMKAAFNRDPRIAFAILMKLVHGLATTKSMKVWLYPKLQAWARTRPSLPFDMKITDINEPKWVHSVCQTAAKYCRQVYAIVVGHEETFFGMSLRLRQARIIDDILKHNLQVVINLGPLANPHGVKTYILISHERYPWAREFHGNTTTTPTGGETKKAPLEMEQILEKFNCADYAYYSYMVAQEALKNGLDRNAALEQLSSALDIAYESGRGMLPAHRSLGDGSRDVPSKGCMQKMESQLFPKRQGGDQRTAASGMPVCNVQTSQINDSNAVGALMGMMGPRKEGNVMQQEWRGLPQQDHWRGYSQEGQFMRGPHNMQQEGRGFPQQHHSRGYSQEEQFPAQQYHAGFSSQQQHQQAPHEQYHPQYGGGISQEPFGIDFPQVRQSQNGQYGGLNMSPMVIYIFYMRMCFLLCLLYCLLSCSNA
jgi:hypothetical protein